MLGKGWEDFIKGRQGVEKNGKENLSHVVRHMGLFVPQVPSRA